MKKQEQTPKTKADKPQEVKPWGGRFSQATDPEVEAFTASIPFDFRLLPYDIAGSQAHARMLTRQGILNKAEGRLIQKGLQEILGEWEQGRLTFTLADEDVHMLVEKRLREKIGPAGGKLHTARSRNDQVALDLRLFLRDQVRQLGGELKALQENLLATAKKYGQAVLPGYTHLQRAQPVLLAHHLLAYLEMFCRDQERLAESWRRINILPLGSAALAGTTFPIDRRAVAADLGFSGIAANSMDAVSDRDFVLDCLSAGSILMMHFSRLAEDLILWSSSEFDFIAIDDAFCTGSSIMPQKKNPDVAELVRGKTGRVYGHLVGVLTLMKGLPMTYNRDLQEDKEAVFDALDTVRQSTRLLARMISRITFKTERMLEATTAGYLLATDLADYLTTKGLDFRTAHGVVGEIVARAIAEGKELEALPLAWLRAVHPAFGPDVSRWLDLRASLTRRHSIGGTAPGRVRRALHALEKKICRTAYPF
ncbi:MAG: argininosuccinate lyase [Desulfobacterota bacterium]|jgi:argininosuccinate lyase|nr:argininosuccinate lyase [Thermodesulfobacteriota bacterium]